MSERKPYVVPVTPGEPGLTGDPAPAQAPKRAADAAAAYAAAAPPDPSVEGEGVDESPAQSERAGAGDRPPPAAVEAEPASTSPVAEPAGDNGRHQVIADDLEELTAKAAKADEYLGLAQRTKADFENFRKRMARDAALAQERGIAKLAKELLPAVDNLDRAVQAAEKWGPPTPGAPAPEADASEETAASHEAQLHAGLKLVHAEVLVALARVGIEPFSPVGETFDPTLHEAVAQMPIEGAPSGTVVEVYQQGYRLGETVLRPARVVVAA